MRFRGLYIPRRVQRELTGGDVRLMSIIGPTGYVFPPDPADDRLALLRLTEVVEHPRLGRITMLSALGRAIVERLTIIDHVLIQQKCLAERGLR